MLPATDTRRTRVFSGHRSLALNTILTECSDIFILAPEVAENLLAQSFSAPEQRGRRPT